MERKEEEEEEYTGLETVRRYEWRRKERKEGECSYGMGLLEEKGNERKEG